MILLVMNLRGGKMITFINKYITYRHFFIGRSIEWRDEEIWWQKGSGTRWASCASERIWGKRLLTEPVRGLWRRTGAASISYKIFICLRDESCDIYIDVWYAFCLLMLEAYFLLYIFIILFNISIKHLINIPQIW